MYLNTWSETDGTLRKDLGMALLKEGYHSGWPPRSKISLPCPVHPLSASCLQLQM